MSLRFFIHVASMLKSHVCLTPSPDCVISPLSRFQWKLESERCRDLCHLVFNIFWRETKLSPNKTWYTFVMFYYYSNSLIKPRLLLSTHTHTRDLYSHWHVYRKQESKLAVYTLATLNMKLESTVLYIHKENTDSISLNLRLGAL